MIKYIIILAGLFLALNAKNISPNPVPVRPPITKRVVQTELTCLAKNIFYEAGSESYTGKLAVATVTMNRVKHPSFPKTVCGVVYQKTNRGCQFSWTCGGRRPLNNHLYQQSLKVAKEVLTNGARVASLKNALYFHNTTIEPDWKFALPIQQIGNHIFYAPRRKYSTART
jgi:spore germination cell wall hydrolase CwlJ-like protein